MINGITVDDVRKYAWASLGAEAYPHEVWANDFRLDHI